MILSEFGRGGMGVVYKAQDTRLERIVALKFLAPHLVTDLETCERFTGKQRPPPLSAASHICTVYELEEIDGKT